MEKNKTGKYLKYAIGEIILVVIGILIALSINNWNQNRLERKKEKAVLTEISNSINSDLIFFEDVLDYRLKIKSEGISKIMKMLSEKDAYLENDSLQFFFTKVQTDITINYDSGPYDALKIYGLEVISNDSLRKSIINNYEVLIPALKKFGDNVPNLLNPLIENLKMDLFKKEPFQGKNGNWHFKYISKNNEIVNNENFFNLIDFELQKYYNYLRRLNLIRRELIKLNISVNKELKYLESK